MSIEHTTKKIMDINKHYTVTYSSKEEYARDGIHINNCECTADLFKIWLSRFMGGNNKYNLNTHAYQFIYNNRGLDILSKFIKIL